MQAGLQVMLRGVAVVACCCALLISLGGCSRLIVGGPCAYVTVVGRAVISRVTEAPKGSYSCVGGVEVVFAFTPDDPSATGRYVHEYWPDQDQRFTVGAGANPPRGWAERVGLLEGSVHRCERHEITKGTCAPVLFFFPEIPRTGWEEECSGQ